MRLGLDKKMFNHSAAHCATLCSITGRDEGQRWSTCVECDKGPNPWHLQVGMVKAPPWNTGQLLPVSVAQEGKSFSAPRAIFPHEQPSGEGALPLFSKAKAQSRQSKSYKPISILNQKARGITSIQGHMPSKQNNNNQEGCETGQIGRVLSLDWVEWRNVISSKAWS